MNSDKVKGKWTEIKGEVQKAWGKLTDDELEQTKGDLKSIKGLIQQKYGDSKEDYEDKLSKIMSGFEGNKERTIKNVKDSLQS